MGELGGGCGVDLGAEWVAVMVVVWVDLGRKLEGFYWVEQVLVWMEKKRKKDAELQWKREGVLGAGRSGFSCSLSDDPKGSEGGGRWRRVLFELGHLMELAEGMAWDGFGQELAGCWQLWQ